MLQALPVESPLAAQLDSLAPTLELASAALARQGLPQPPPQLVVLGPTQAGKSSVVNLILGQEAAGVSPLAGFTIHAHGFLHGVTRLQLEWLDDFFAPYRHTAAGALPRDRYDCFTTRELPDRRPQLPPCVVWDTPDFDSLRARNYRHSLMKTLGLADLVVLVVSKDKYADQSVWELLSLIEPLGQPLLVCVNKVPPENQSLLIQSWRQKWNQHRRDPLPPIVVLPYHTDGQGLEQQGEEIRVKLAPLWKQAARRQKQLNDPVRHFIREHWSLWTAPIRAQHEADARWENLVTVAMDQVIDIYRHDFLDHPIAYETLQRALAELLILLELPGLARPMAMFRKVLTWPFRALRGQGRQTPTEPVGELLVLNRSVEHALLQLQQSLSEQLQQRQNFHAYWWRALELNYRDSADALRQHFRLEAEAYYQDFQPQVEAAARSLYRRLKEMPVTLNGLRAARASADAAGLALLVHTGGIGPHDLVLAPAMLSLTSWLSESALGKYMDRVAAELRQRQLEAVQSLLRQGLQGELLALPERIDSPLRFQVSAEALGELEKQLKERRHGLKLF